uniref:non-specific serine/threonine protein kinase n=1 Tax=Gouania willdenowi TaxID=441366 RepID=A0A8C5NAV5_GOUWI
MAHKSEVLRRLRELIAMKPKNKNKKKSMAPTIKNHISVVGTEKASREVPTPSSKKRKNEEDVVKMPCSKKTKVEDEVATLNSKKRKAEEEVEEERPEKRCCLDSGDHEKRKHMPNVKAKSSSPKVKAVESQSFGSKKSSSNPPIPLQDEDRFLFTSSNQSKASPELVPPAPHYFDGYLFNHTSLNPVLDKNIIISKTSINEFNAKYEECNVLGKGIYGIVYAGIRRSDLTQVAVKHIPKEEVSYMFVNYQNSIYICVSEAILMAQAAGQLFKGSKVNRGVIGLLDVYDLEKEVLIVMERPKKSMDITEYIEKQEGHVPEHEAKSIMKQLLDAAQLMHYNGVFHQDIKDTNVLVSLEEESLPIRIIDFGCGDFVKIPPCSEYCGTLPCTPAQVLEAEFTTVWQMGALLKNLFERQHHIHKGYSFLSQECIDFMNQCLTFVKEQRLGFEELRCHSWLQ